MAKRLSASQSVHDACVEAAAGRFKKSFDVCTNPGSQQNCAVTLKDGSEGYPDIVAYSEGSKQVSCLGEIETSESITEDERDSQWIPYAEVKSALRLYVPREDVQKAKDLIGTRSDIKLRAWTRKSDGSFSWQDIDD